jgi:hypothetical protein
MTGELDHLEFELAVDQERLKLREDPALWERILAADSSLHEDVVWRCLLQWKASELGSDLALARILALRHELAETRASEPSDTA